MLLEIINCVEALIIFLSFILIAKYVFLEKGVQGKEKILYYSISIVLILFSAFFLPESIRTLVVVIAGLFFLFLGRKNNKGLGMLIAIPITGIIDGLFLPVVSMPIVLIGWDEIHVIIFKSIVYSIILLAIIALIVCIKIRDHKYGKTLSDRELQNWERVLLFFVGTFQLFFSNLINSPLSKISTQIKEIENFSYIITLLGISSFVMTVIVIIVIVVGNNRIYYKDRVSDMQFNMIVMMAEIVENRDADTGGHIQRTAKYVEIIAKKMKRMGMHEDIITDQYINDIMVAAPLHDLGKIHVSDLILNKPGRLTDEEFEEMKKHASEGRKLLLHAKEHLGDFTYLDMAVDMAGSHHEWWDGSAKGYPDHLAGEDIPLSARIMAVADVFDALTAKRVYKDPMPFNKAVNIIKDECGTHFDPDVVNAFIDSLPQIQTELNNFEKMGVKMCEHDHGEE